MKHYFEELMDTYNLTFAMHHWPRRTMQYLKDKCQHSIHIQADIRIGLGGPEHVVDIDAEELNSPLTVPGLARQDNEWAPAIVRLRTKAA